MIEESGPEDAILHLRGIGVRRGGKQILRDVDWTMRRGENWAVIGANGSGKTTLLQIAGGCLFPTAGTAVILGKRLGACDMFALRQRVGWVSSALLSRMPPSETLREIVISGLKATFGLVYEYGDRDVVKADGNIARVGLTDRASTQFGVLSQGEQQKTLFARSMMADPELFILDEACSGLDLSARESFLRVVEGVIDGARAGVIMVTHHIEEIPPGVTHALVLKEGRVLAADTAEKALGSEVLSDAFGIRITVERKNRRFWARVE